MDGSRMVHGGIIRFHLRGSVKIVRVLCGQATLNYCDFLTNLQNSQSGAARWVHAEGLGVVLVFVWLTEKIFVGLLINL